MFRAMTTTLPFALPRRAAAALALAGVLSLGACAADAPPEELDTSTVATVQDEFWRELQSLCGNAYGGRMTVGGPNDTDLDTAALRMHVRECGADTIRIPFHVGENRSRTWVLTRSDGALRLKHDHRHEDGTEDSITQYGGDTRDRGTPTRQEFYADSLTAALIPAARTNVWTMELIADSLFAYALRREGTDRRVRVEFDLRRTVEEPAAPWGGRN
jgi:hypothetical protein